MKKEPGYTIRNCNKCGKQYQADNRNLNRGWGLCCSKACAAKKREQAKPGYNPTIVAMNNDRRENWNEYRGYDMDLGERANAESPHNWNFDDMDGHFSNEDN